MRTGSSFVGELLGNSQDIFYLFEPGLSLLNTLEGLEGQREVLRSSYLGMLRRLYRCDFKHLDFYLEWLSRRQTLLPKFAPRLHDLCSNSLIRGKCMLTRGMATGSCLQSGYIVVKSIRVRDIMVLLPMMEDSATNLKVIHLLRDPRPTIASRVLAQTKKKVTQLSQSVREYLYLHCKFNLENFELGTRNPYIKNRYMFLRYEDAAMDPLAAAKRMHRFLGHKEVPESVLKWIAANTESKKPALTYSTARNSSEAYRAWRSNLPFDTAKEIEETGECPQMMARLGYHSLEDETHLRNMSRSLVGSIPIGHDDRKYDWVWEL
ncbi:carbohydrate sulfotransferase 3-like [Acanthaster planci]|uniref:Carbohydrate sulfotransferase 3-like n=1 Tax=Acanthaster planci TaxID=133434 RepID=A0A8B7Z5Y9_ACAPL|nr:carbohydrate sulfotransferase 3-like [Acanthaster planci]